MPQAERQQETNASATLRDLWGNQTAKLETELDFLSELHTSMDEVIAAGAEVSRRRTTFCTHSLG